MAKRKKLVDLVADLDDTRVESSEAPTAPEDAPRETDILSKARALSPEDKKWQAFEWSMLGHDVPGIARMFDVTPSTIYRWLRDLYRQHREGMEQVPGADVLSEHLLWLGKLEEVCLHEINTLRDEESSIDPSTGEISRNTDPKLKAVRVKYVQAALRARQMKIEMLQKANVLPVEPEKIYHTMSDERRKTEEVEESSVEKSREEIEANIKKLISKGLSL